MDLLSKRLSAILSRVATACLAHQQRPHHYGLRKLRRGFFHRETEPARKKRDARSEASRLLGRSFRSRSPLRARPMPPPYTLCSQSLKSPPREAAKRTCGVPPSEFRSCFP